VEESAYRSYKDRGLLILNVFVKAKDKDIREFTETFHLTFPVGRDNGITDTFQIKSIPVTIFIGKDGEVKKRINDTIENKPLREGIEQLLQ